MSGPGPGRPRRGRTSPSPDRHEPAPKPRGSAPSRILAGEAARLAERMVPAAIRPLLLPVACAAAIAVLATSEFLTMFEFRTATDSLGDVQTGGERHAYALTVLSAFALIALIAWLTTGARPPAMAVGVAGAAALLIFLLIDLPDAGKVGELADPVRNLAEAEPALGFWLELAGAVALAATGVALAVGSGESRLEEAPPAARDGSGAGSASGERSYQR